jgi:predicted nucleotidyltransferase
MDQKTVIDQFARDFEVYEYDYLVSKWVIEKLPYIFNGNYDSFLKTKLKLSRLLKVDSCSIIFVGSACTGFSLSPFKKLREFNEKSDIDIAIVSHYYFDVAWHTMRNIRPFDYSTEVQDAIKEHASKFIYWGTIATDKILGILPFAKEWLCAQEEISKEPIFENRKVNFRLYQDHEALRTYHLRNFKSNLPDILGVKSESIMLKCL